MSDVAAKSRTPLNIKPVEVQSLIRELPRSKRGGYVEDVVDEHLKDFANQINGLVRQHDALVRELNKRDAEPAQAPVVANPFQATEEENAERIAGLYRDAQRSSREFVEEARERAAGIVGRAEQEAADTRVTLEAEVESVRERLTEYVNVTRDNLAHEVADTRDQLAHETAALNEVRDRLTAETQEIFVRLRAFHETQLDTLEQHRQTVTFDAVATAEVAFEDADLTVEAAPLDEPGADDADSEPEVFAPEEPQEAPEASTSDLADEDLTITSGAPEAPEADVEDDETDTAESADDEVLETDAVVETTGKRR